jgi:hypothetical protein
MYDATAVERQRDQTDVASFSYEVSDEALEAAAKEDCASGRLMLSATSWGCPC